MAAKRVAVTPEQIQNFFCEGFRIIEGAPAHFVFNMDEMGYQEWADRKNATCVVPSSHEENHVNFPVADSKKDNLTRVHRIRRVFSDDNRHRPQKNG
jgi:hypothetical protein